MSRLVDAVFRVSLVVFLLLGCALVLLQLVGVIGLSSGLVVGASERLGPPAFMAAGVTGVLAYVLSYLRSDSAAAAQEEGA